MKPKRDGVINQLQWKAPGFALFAADAGNAFCPETCIIPHMLKSYQDQSEHFEPGQNPLPKYCYS